MLMTCDGCKCEAEYKSMKYLSVLDIYGDRTAYYLCPKCYAEFYKEKRSFYENRLETQADKS